MAAESHSQPAEQPDSEQPVPLRPDPLEAPPDDQGLSLEELSKTYAELIGGGHDPYREAPQRGKPALPERAESDELEDEEEGEPADGEEGDACGISPRSILEAMLFVGHPENEPLTSRTVAALMRGVRPSEVDELVRDLNEVYLAEGCPYTIVSAGSGYRLVLRDEYASLRDRFYGRVKEARLSQAAIDVLAVVAYHQGLTREELDDLRGKPSGGILSQLVRRALLRLERTGQKPKVTRYYTTSRFLELFGLESLDDLPRSQDLDRS